MYLERPRGKLFVYQKQAGEKVLLLWLVGFYGGFATSSLIHLLLVAAVIVLALNLSRAGVQHRPGEQGGQSYDSGVYTPQLLNTFRLSSTRGRLPDGRDAIETYSFNAMGQPKQLQSPNTQPVQIELVPTQAVTR